MQRHQTEPPEVFRWQRKFWTNDRVTRSPKWKKRKSRVDVSWFQFFFPHTPSLMLRIMSPQSSKQLSALKLSKANSDSAFIKGEELAQVSARERSSFKQGFPFACCALAFMNWVKAASVFGETWGKISRDLKIWLNFQPESFFFYLIMMVGATSG